MRRLSLSVLCCIFSVTCFAAVHKNKSGARAVVSRAVAHVVRKRAIRRAVVRRQRPKVNARRVVRKNRVVQRRKSNSRRPTRRTMSNRRRPVAQSRPAIHMVQQAPHAQPQPIQNHVAHPVQVARPHVFQPAIPLPPLPLEYRAPQVIAPVEHVQPFVPVVPDPVVVRHVVHEQRAQDLADLAVARLQDMRRIQQQQRVADVVPAAVPVPVVRVPAEMQPVAALPLQILPAVQESEAPVIPARDLQQVAAQERRPVIQQRGAPALPPRHALPILEENFDTDAIAAVQEGPIAEVVHSAAPTPTVQPLSSPVATMLARAQHVQMEADDTVSEAGSEWDIASLDEDEDNAYDRAEILTRRPAPMGAPTDVVSPEQQRQNRTQEGAQAELVRAVLLARNRVMHEDDQENDAFSD